LEQVGKLALSVSLTGVLALSGTGQAMAESMTLPPEALEELRYVMVQIGQNEYSKLEESLYTMGSQKTGPDVEDVCTYLASVCTDETTVWTIDETPGVHVLVKKEGERIRSIYFEHNGFIMDRFEVSAAGVKIDYDGRYYYTIGNCDGQGFSVTSRFSFGGKHITIIAKTRSEPCGKTNREYLRMKEGSSYDGGDLQTTVVSYYMQEVQE
jgi:hypothetical protein